MSEQINPITGVPMTRVGRINADGKYEVVERPYEGPGAKEIERARRTKRALEDPEERQKALRALIVEGQSWEREQIARSLAFEAERLSEAAELVKASASKAVEFEANPEVQRRVLRTAESKAAAFRIQSAMFARASDKVSSLYGRDEKGEAFKLDPDV